MSMSRQCDILTCEQQDAGPPSQALSQVDGAGWQRLQRSVYDDALEGKAAQRLLLGYEGLVAHEDDTGQRIGVVTCRMQQMYGRPSKAVRD